MNTASDETGCVSVPPYGVADDFGYHAPWDLVRAASEGRLLAWCIAHVPDGDGDAAIARVWYRANGDCQIAMLELAGCLGPIRRRQVFFPNDAQWNPNKMPSLDEIRAQLSPPTIAELIERNRRWK